MARQQASRPDAAAATPPPSVPAAADVGRVSALGGRVAPGAPATALVALLLVIGAALALQVVAGLVVPILFGLFIALIAWPAVGALERRGARHGVALAGTIGIVLVVVLVAVLTIGISLAELALMVPRYEARLRDLVTQAGDLLAQAGIAEPAAAETFISPGTIVELAQTAASSVSRAAGSIFILAFTLIYGLTGAAGLKARAAVVLGPEHPLADGVERFARDLRRYLVLRAQLGLFAAVPVFVLLLVLGIPLPLLWAVLVFAASFIPNIGTLIALVPPALLGLVDGGIVTAALVVAGYGLINVAQDYLLQPRLMGMELNLSALVVFLSVIVWAWVLGPAGALLAVPLTVGVVAIMEGTPGTRPLAQLLRARIEPDAPAGADGASAT
ncbi:MAG: AI-2E family transporter [Chloroflexota bacterium]